MKPNLPPPPQYRFIVNLRHHELFYSSFVRQVLNNKCSFVPQSVLSIFVGYNSSGSEDAGVAFTGAEGDGAVQRFHG